MLSRTTQTNGWRVTTRATGEWRGNVYFLSFTATVASTPHALVFLDLHVPDVAICKSAYGTTAHLSDDDPVQLQARVDRLLRKCA